VADTLGRVIRRVAAGSASTSNRFAALEALDALSAQVWLTSDINHLGDESTYRTIASIPGFIDLQRPSPTGATTAASPADFDWFGRFLPTGGSGSNPACQCLGEHVIHRVARDAATWPDIVLRARVQPPVGLAEKLNVCLVVVPGINGNAAVITDRALYTITTVAGNGGVWADLTMTLSLAAGSVSTISERPLLGAPSSGVPGDSEIVAVSVLTAWVSAYSTSGKCSIAPITVALEPA